MSYNYSGDGYIACNPGEGFNSFRFGSEKENYNISSYPINMMSNLSNKIDRNAKFNRELDRTEKSPSCFSLSPKSGGSPEFGDEYSLFRSRSTSLSSSGSLRSTGTVCESDISGRQRSLRSTEPPSRVLTPLELEPTRNVLFIQYK